MTDLDLTVPPYVRPGQVAVACGISRAEALTELRDAGLIERRKSGRMRVSSTRLRELRPALFERVYLWFAKSKGTM